MSSSIKSKGSVSWDPRLDVDSSSQRSSDASSLPTHYPAPPSLTKSGDEQNIPTVCVWNANTPEGISMVRVLSEKGLQVVAVVSVFAGKKVKQLRQLKRVRVRVADWRDRTSLMVAVKGCVRAFLISRYWEHFETSLEEERAVCFLEAAAYVGVQSFVMATFEDALKLERQGFRSQVEVDRRGRIFKPRFEGMVDINNKARHLGISLSHMMTSYMDSEGSRKTLVLIRGPKGKVVVKHGAWTLRNRRCFLGPHAPMGKEEWKPETVPLDTEPTKGFGFSDGRWLKRIKSKPCRGRQRRLERYSSTE